MIYTDFFDNQKIPSYWIKDSLAESMAIIKFASFYRHETENLRVLRSLSLDKYGTEWIHISVARPSRIPSWDDMCLVKNDFLGEDVEAYQVFPKKKEYVNVMKYCLHIWAPTDGTRKVVNLFDIVDEVAI